MSDTVEADTAEPGSLADGGSPGPAWRLPFFLLFVGLVYFVVQFDKPVHIDDPQYLYAARHLLEDPWRPLTNEINWKTTPEPAYRDLINPPFYIYLQAAWMALFGDSVRGLHLLSAAMAVLAAAGGFLVARRFTRHALVASALVLLSPNVVPVANLMVDVPVLAVGLVAVAVFIAGVDRRSPARAALGALLVGLAVLTKYNAVVLIPILASYALLRGRIRYAAYQAIPVGMLLLWSLHNVLVFGEAHILITAGFEGYERNSISWWRSFYSLAVVPGSTFIFLGVFGLAKLRLRGLSIWGPIGALVLIGPTQMVWWQAGRIAHPEYWAFALNTVLLVAFAAAVPKGTPAEPRGRLPLASISKLFERLRQEPSSAAESRRRDEAFLWLWIAGVMLFQLLFAYHQAPRYHVLAFLPLAILLVRTLAAAIPKWTRREQAVVWGSVGLQLVVALFVAAADDAHARANRNFPPQVARLPESQGVRVFCIGHWGLQYYCEEQGFTTLDAIHGSLRQNDLVIVPENNYLTNMPKAFKPIPTGRPLCSDKVNEPFFELLQEKLYTWDDLYARPAAGGSFFGTRLLAGFHALWPFSVSLMHDSLLYGSLVPALPYSWRIRGRDSPEERFMLLRARCDYSISTERLDLDFGSYVTRMHLVSGWGAPLPWRDVWGSWNVGGSSQLEVILDHRQRDYVLRVKGFSVRHPENEPVTVAVAVNGYRVGKLEFTPQASTEELVVPAETLSPLENTVAFFGFSYMERPIGTPPKAIFFYGIELAPLSASGSSSEPPDQEPPEGALE